jgi:hypothetical protein
VLQKWRSLTAAPKRSASPHGKRASNTHGQYAAARSTR